MVTCLAISGGIVDLRSLSLDRAKDAATLRGAQDLDLQAVKLEELEAKKDGGCLEDGKARRDWRLQRLGPCESAMDPAVRCGAGGAL